MALDKVISLENAVIQIEDHIVLEQVDLSVEKGEFVYIIGRVGIGKTSLIKTINAELPLIEGTGMVSVFNLEHLKRKDIPMLRRKLGIVFQDFKLLIDRTVDANLEFALKATSSGKMTAQQIEAARVAATRYMKRQGSLWIKIFPDKPITKKPLEVRMGKGKGNVEYWVAQIQPGRMLYEMEGVSEDIAREAFRLAAAKLPVSTTFVSRTVL